MHSHERWRASIAAFEKAGGILTSSVQNFKCEAPMTVPNDLSATCDYNSPNTFPTGDDALTLSGKASLIQNDPDNASDLVDRNQQVHDNKTEKKNEN